MIKLPVVLILNISKGDPARSAGGPQWLAERRGSEGARGAERERNLAGSREGRRPGGFFLFPSSPSSFSLGSLPLPVPCSASSDSARKASSSEARRDPRRADRGGAPDARGMASHDSGRPPKRPRVHIDPAADLAGRCAILERKLDDACRHMVTLARDNERFVVRRAGPGIPA